MEELNDALATKEEISQRCRELDMQVSAQLRVRTSDVDVTLRRGAETWCCLTVCVALKALQVQEERDSLRLDCNELEERVNPNSFSPPVPCAVSTIPRSFLRLHVCAHVCTPSTQPPNLGVCSASTAAAAALRKSIHLNIAVSCSLILCHSQLYRL